MSGVSLAVDPKPQPDDTATSSTTTNQKRPLHKEHQQRVAPGLGVMPSLRMIELQLVAFVVVFSASGLVPLFDLVFPALTSAYLLCLARFAFPSRGAHDTGQQDMFQGSKLFRLYEIVGTTIGLFLPLAYVLGGFARGDDHAVRSASPHLFLLSFQILTENIISGLSLFSPPVRAFVPLLYAVRRIFVIMDWMHDVWLDKTLPANASPQDIVWYWYGRTLSTANFLYFSINLFGFLIPRFLPRAFERYLLEKDELHSKMAEDKHFGNLGKSQAAGKNQEASDKKAD